MIEEGNFSGVEILEVYTRKDEGVERGEAHWNDSQSPPPSWGDHTAPECSKTAGLLRINRGYMVPLMVRQLNTAVSARAPLSSSPAIKTNA